MASDKDVRDHLARVLDWGDAHASFDKAVAGFPVELRGKRPRGLPHSAWQLLEHLRIAQHDILDFCRNPKYRAMKWPDDYWPASPEPPSEDAWNASIKGYRRDRTALQRLAGDASRKLTSRIPHGTGQTYLRELLLVADHTAYHVGQLVSLRRVLGAWQKD